MPCALDLRLPYPRLSLGARMAAKAQGGAARQTVEKRPPWDCYDLMGCLGSWLQLEMMDSAMSIVFSISLREHFGSRQENDSGARDCSYAAPRTSKLVSIRKNGRSNARRQIAT